MGMTAEWAAVLASCIALIISVWAIVESRKARKEAERANALQRSGVIHTDELKAIKAYKEILRIQIQVCSDPGNFSDEIFEKADHTHPHYRKVIENLRVHSPNLAQKLSQKKSGPLENTLKRVEEYENDLLLGTEKRNNPD